MRLLILTPEYDEATGGIITFYRSLAPALRAVGVKLRVIEGSAFHAGAERYARQIEGVAVETLESHRLARWWDRFPAFVAAPGLRRHLAAAWAMWEQAGYGADADVVEACDWGLLFIPPAVEATRPLIVQCHGSIGQIAIHDPIAGEETQSLFARLLERAVLGVAGEIQTHSHANAAFWRAETRRDIGMIRPAWRQAVVPVPERLSNRGLVVGRVQRWKGPETLCQALERLGHGAPCLDWFGRDTAWGAREDSSIAHLARVFPRVWGTKIFYGPPIPPTEVARRQAAALFNLVPSTWDVFNFTAVEAMASGRPTIVSKGAGASELIEHGVNGFLFGSGDADALAATIDYVLNESRQRLADIGLAGRETVQLELDPEAVAKQRIAVYNSAIQKFTAPEVPVEGWLGEICRPTANYANEEMAFLEHQPLRALAGHVVSRISRRVLASMRISQTLALLIPAYNAAAYLPRLLKSAASQTEPFDEILVYDDCSTDETASLAANFGARIVRGEVNRGCSFGKNVLATRTTADWLHFHDADDELGLDFVALARKWMNDARFDVVLFPYEERDDATGEHMGYRIFDPADIAGDIRSYAIRQQINPFCGLYRREAYLRAGGYDEDPLVLYNEDVAMHIGLAFEGLSFAAETEVSIINHRRFDSMSADNRLKCLQAQYHVMRKTAARNGADPYSAEIAERLWNVVGGLTAELDWHTADEAAALATKLVGRTATPCGPAFNALCGLSPHLALRTREMLIRALKPRFREGYPGWRAPLSLF